MTNLAVANDIREGLTRDLASQNIETLLPKDINIDTFIRAATVAMVQNESLALCEKSSVVMALTKCATDGLLPDGREAALVPYSVQKNGKWVKHAEYIPMVDGVLKRARMSGKIKLITGKAVYSEDEFDYFVDENGEHILHRPVYNNRGDFVLAFAFATLADGTLAVEIVDRVEADKIRSTVKGSDKSGSAWSKWFDRMAIKSALHRLSNRLPNSSEIKHLLDHQPAQTNLASELDITPQSSKLKKVDSAEPSNLDDILDGEVLVQEEPAAQGPQATAPENIDDIFDGSAFQTLYDLLKDVTTWDEYEVNHRDIATAHQKKDITGEEFQQLNNKLVDIYSKLDQQ